MSDTSIKLRDHISSVSTVVEENAKAATQMQSTARSVREIMSPVAESARGQALLANDLSAQSNAVSRQFGDMADLAERAVMQTTKLTTLVENFDIDGDRGFAGPYRETVAALP